MSAPDGFTEATQHYDEIRRYAHQLCDRPADAEDVTQTTFEKALENWETYENGTNCRAWLYCICRNTFINRQRRKGEYLHPDTQEDRDPYHDITEGHLASAVSLPPADNPARSVIEDAIDDLPTPYRRVVRLVDVRDLQYKTAAAKMDCPVGTIMSRLYRARRILRERLGSLADIYGLDYDDDES